MSAAELQRARRALERVQAENVRIAADLEASGLTSFVDCVEWLRAEWRRRWTQQDVAPAPASTRLLPSSPCVRCGVPRIVKPGRPGSGLCRDCYTSLSREERAVWAA